MKNFSHLKVLQRTYCTLYPLLRARPQLLQLPLRQKIWINKHTPPEWIYGEQEDLMNVELAKSLDTLKQGEKAAFLIVDLREESERDMMDLPKYTKNKVLIPRVNIPLEDLQMGYYPDKLPKDKYLILVCNQGLKSGRAADFLKRQGYYIKILIGGIETLDNLVDLQFGSGGYF
ncbi:hypothetical protein FGO68_gene16349 [Halteria grandinella]|uniref:Rhodanese domain-containing protein n=1 Tax=Halteria grandinella TaxID=5974 RepID=A0A8J8NZ50_HALGN|nr:hypothetical protein FGO68_gene16349 [Halteria grandinella]